MSLGLGYGIGLWARAGAQARAHRPNPQPNPKPNSIVRRVLTTTALAAFATAVLSCTQALTLAPDDSKTVLATQAITAPNPGLPGTLHVKTLYYGSGTDKRRPEYRDSVTFKTPSVDGTAFVSIMGDAAKAHDKTWGFTLKKMPLNGRVWYPEGDGPFPLVLVVHGNHDPEDYSDPGYRYLGEQLASHGFILVSVDENFINGLSGENDGRGWLLLKHLELWKKWNDSTGSPFRGKVDMHKIALMGHSRGGEAIAHAATFNRLKYYPDDAKVKLDFNFDIKSLVAIAPVDGQYKPASVFEPLENVNYLWRAAPIPAAPLHRRPAVVQVGLVRIPRESRPVESGLGQQGQRPAERALARPARTHLG
jgi:dienelactone hydrolase